MTDFQEVMVNGRWKLKLLSHRAARPEWSFWEAHRLALTHSLIEPGMTMWEIGAEEGDYPALYGTWGANVVAVEPNPYVWPQIKLHWEANSLDMLYEDDEGVFQIPTLIPIVALASDEMVEAELDYPSGFFDGWPEVAYGEVMPEHGFRHIWEHSGVSPQLRLEEVDLPVPDLVCMDIEGGELHALRGMEGVLRSYRPDLVVSVHPEFLRDLYGYSPADVSGFLASVGYEGRRFCTDHEEHWHFWPAERPPPWG